MELWNIFLTYMVDVVLLANETGDREGEPTELSVET